MIENIKIARYCEVLKSKYLHCYLILLFSLSICQKVTRTMLTYHDSSGSFSHRYICSCNEIRHIDLKGPQLRPLSEQGQNLSAKIEPKSTESYITNLEVLWTVWILRLKIPLWPLLATTESLLDAEHHGILDISAFRDTNPPLPCTKYTFFRDPTG